MRFFLPLKIIAALIGCSFLGGVSSARLDAADPPPFEVSAEKGMGVWWRGKPLIVRDELQAVSEEAFHQPEKVTSGMVGQRKVFNVWRVEKPNEQVTWRREVAVGEGEAEWTVQYRVPAYYYENQPEERDSFYRVYVPLAALEGCRWEAVVVAEKRRSTLKGKVVDGKMNLDKSIMVSYLTFTTAEGETLTLDFGPAGVTSYNPYVAPSSLPESWWMSQGDGYLRFSIGRFKTTTHPYNGVFFGKIRITQADFGSYSKVRGHLHYTYFQDVPPIRQFSFGKGFPGRDWIKSGYDEILPVEWGGRKYDLWTPVPTELFSHNRGFGWESIDGIELRGDAAKGVLHGRASGESPATFRVDVPEPGIYLFTLRIGADEKARGPFDLSCNGETVAKGVRLEANEVKMFTFGSYIDGRTAKLEFSGAWAVSTIAIQKLIYEAEDFTFKRGMWLADGLPAPTTMYQFERRPVPTLAAIQSIPAKSGSPASVKVNQPGPERAVHLDPADPATLWRWDGSVNTLGRGSLHEFETETEINRRLDELQELGYSIILVNGYLIRHAFPEEHARMRATMTRVAKLAHARGMKVLDHFDLTIVPNQGSAYRQFVENLDWVQKDVRNGQVTRGYCINNPHFQSYFFNLMVEYVKEANIDGLMLDEVSWHGRNYCGCQYCRAKFTADTGLVLPMDETSPDLLNDGSRLWREWLLWRPKAQGDFSVGLMEAIRKIRPDFVTMKYGAPTVYVSDLSIQKSGSRLSQAHRYSSFLGIELLSHNLHATYRSNLAVGSIFNSYVDTWQIPAYALVYHQHDPVIAYAGWAMNNMNCMRTWTVQGNRAIEEDAPRYLRWKDNMDHRKVRQVADVAVYFSENSRDLAENRTAVSQELVGMCEQLDDLHLLYKVLLDQDLSLEKLRPYRLLVLPATKAMSDEELAIIRQYLEEGGQVLATADTAMADGLGFQREVWPLGAWLGLAAHGEVNGASVTGDKLALKAPVVLKEPALLVRDIADAMTGREILAGLQDGGEKGVAAVEVAMGKGKLIWAAPRLGAENFEHDGRFKRKVVMKENRPALGLLGQLLKRSPGSKSSFSAVKMPREVRTRVYRQEEGEGAGTWVHLYNGSGSRLKGGEAIPGEVPAIPYPPMRGELIFEIAMGKAEGVVAEYVTPDGPEVHPVGLKALGEGRYRVSVPATALKGYGAVRLRASSAPTL